MISNCKYTAGRLTTETAGAAGNNALRRTEYAYGWLDKVMSVTDSRTVPIAYIKYFYSPDGQITARDVSAGAAPVRYNYQYDLKGQLLAVVDASGKAVEQYVYDPAGNILSKTIDDNNALRRTEYKYDKANQLVSSNNAVSRTDYEYDAAGRLTKEGDKFYQYGWLDKVMSVSENGKLSASFDYGIDGQLASRIDATGKSENFTWDGLALIKRDSTNFVNESAVTGGNPILAFGKDSSKVLFEDMLGSSVGSVECGKFNAINRTAFGEPLSNSRTSELSNFSSDFFTGKPQVEGLGYAFLFRNYRAEQGKWQTADPLGYPDGWNNLAYVNNRITRYIDWLGARTVVLVGDFNSDDAYYNATNYWLDQKTQDPEITILSYSTKTNAQTLLANNSQNNPIDKLYIVDHGSSGVQQVGDGELNAGNVGAFFNNVNFSTNASISFEGCNVGTGTDGRNFAIAASQATHGATVSVATDVVTYGYNGTTYVRNYPSAIIVSVAE